jgi:hypothetical protein
MAAPNIVNVANLFGETEQYTPTTNESSATSNSSGSGKVYRINSIRVSNVNGSGGADANITIKYRDNVSGTPSAIHLAYEIIIPVQSSLEVVSNSFYLKEDQDIRLLASANSALEVLISYEDISD